MNEWVAEISPTNFDIHVFILHSRSVDELEMSLDSVRNQDFNGDVCLTVLGDQHVPLDIPNADYVVDPATQGAMTKNEFILRKRQWCIRNAKAHLVCFLDDDNWWDRDHLRVLFEALGADVMASYGWRNLWDQHGAPYTKAGDPWARCAARSAGTHLYDLGVRTAGSNQYRDRLYEAPIDGFYGCIDLGSWLGRLQFWQQFLFNTPDADHGEDDMICKHLAGSEATIAATERATVNYTIRDDHSYA